MTKNITGKQKKMSNLKEMTFFAFGDTILLRDVHARALMNDPLSNEVISQDRVKEISFPISAEYLAIGGELCSDHSVECFKIVEASLFFS